MTCDYRYRGIPGWNPGADLASHDDPGLTADAIAVLTGAPGTMVRRWTAWPSFPSPLYRPWARERKWPEEKVRQWLRGRGLISAG